MESPIDSNLTDAQCELYGWIKEYMKKFQQDKNVKTHRFFRVINEIPTVLIILIVFLVILRP